METIVAGLNEPNKVLVLFDEELQQEDGRRGRDLIQEVKDRNWHKAIVPVLFSNIIPSYRDELSQRDTIISEMAGGLTVQDFFALSKKA
ncbi:MAG: hypothetical protein IPM82_30250 [Saprospiraceae bacterium]|nr:hypothetical protein [Saprospiraceae bacterium]